MEKFTIVQRHEIYSLALAKFPSLSHSDNFLCNLLSSVIRDKYGFYAALHELKILLPEFVEQKPVGVNFGDVWFPMIDSDKRLSVLQNCVDATKPIE